MIYYTTKDIVTKAKQLADLTNSDFISYSEELSLLNDAYMKMYQTSINASDLLYLKKGYLVDGYSCDSDLGNVKSYELPRDFFQLYSVKVLELGTMFRPLTRKSKDTDNLPWTYEIKNNSIKIYGRAVEKVYIEYFPMPKSLLLKNEDRAIERRFNLGQPIAYHNTTLVAFANNKIHCIDTDNFSSYKSWELADDIEPNRIVITKAIAGDNGVIVHYTLNDAKKVFITDYDEDTGTISEDTGDIVVIEDNCVFLEKPITPDITSIAYIDEDKMFQIKVTEKGEFLNDRELRGTGNRIELYEDEKLFIINDQNILQICDLYNGTIYTDYDKRGSKFISVGSYNLTTGYGYLVKENGRGYKIISPFSDTELMYPNNLYFNLIAYSLAISFKVKQGADISGLSLTYNKALDQYFDMFKRDVNAPLRINKLV